MAKMRRSSRGWGTRGVMRLSAPSRGHRLGGDGPSGCGGGSGPEGGLGALGTFGRCSAQIGDLEGTLADGGALLLDEVGVAIGAGAHGALQVSAAEMQGNSVIGGVATAHTVGHRPVVLGTAGGLGVVVDTV